MKVVVINSGSSSVKYEVFEASDFSVLSSGLLERIGESESQHTHRAYGPSGTVKETVRKGRVANHEDGFRFILSMPTDSAVNKDSSELLGMGHRGGVLAWHWPHRGCAFGKSWGLRGQGG